MFWCADKKSTWTAALNEISDKLKKAPAGSVAIIASARQTNEELWLFQKLKAKLGAIRIPFRAIWRRRQVAGQRGSKSEHERRAAHGNLLQANVGIKSAADCRTASRRQNQDADRFRRRRDEARHRRGFARQAGHAHRQRYFAERRRRSWRIMFCPAARMRKSAARSRTPRAAFRNS